MPTNECLAREAKQVCGLVDILAVIEHIDFYRAGLRSSRGGGGEVLQEFGRITCRIRRFKRQQQGGGGRDAVHLILQRLGRKRRVPIHHLVQSIQVNEQRARAHKINVH